jgi:hypothetical protein
MGYLDVKSLTSIGSRSHEPHAALASGSVTDGPRVTVKPAPPCQAITRLAIDVSLARFRPVVLEIVLQLCVAAG